MPDHAPSLSSREISDLQDLFGPGTGAGKCLRRVFGIRSKYVPSTPKRRTKPPRNVPVVPPLPKPSIKYPKFHRSQSSPSSTRESHRRRYSDIRIELSEYLEATTRFPPRVDLPDSAVSKAELQIKFQFGYTKMLPPSVAPPLVGTEWLN
jgi:hypothetical protein